MSEGRHWYTPSPNPSSQQENLLAAIFGKPNPNKMIILCESDLQDTPFRGLLYWSRRVMFDPIKKESKYTFSLWAETVKGTDKADYNCLTDQKEYWAWKKAQPEEELYTPFGKKMFAWVEKPFVRQSLIEATRFYAGFLIRENKKAIEDIKSGKRFLEYNWDKLLQARSHLQDLENAMYRLELTNAGFWDYDFEFAENMCWVEALWAVLKHQKISPVTYNKTWQQYRQMRSRDWWLNDIDPTIIPDELYEDSYGHEHETLRPEFNLAKWER